MKKKTEQNAAGAPQVGKTAGAGAAGFLKKNWKWLVPVACVAVLGGVWLLKPKADKPASVDTSLWSAKGMRSAPPLVNTTRIKVTAPIRLEKAGTPDNLQPRKVSNTPAIVKRTTSHLSGNN